jgi:quercetin dioxygenase-like cupin family protein
MGRWTAAAVGMAVLLAVGGSAYAAAARDGPGRAPETAPLGATFAGQPPRPVAMPIASGTLASPAHTMTIAHSMAGTAASVSEISDVRVIRFELAPGGAFPWHQHPGPVWVIVMRGTLTFYSAACEAHPYPAGSAFFDPGNLTHTALNEGSEPVEILATFLFPANAGPAASMPQPDPGTCPFRA